tara:strand:- start:13919 stop:15559 length:1641 start_codon:yes stop_codon:yes gene_type:complete
MPTLTYLGNPNLKAKGVPVNFDKEHVKEYIKCSKNPVYFAKNYVKIINVDKGLVPFKLYKFQKEMVETFNDNRFSICKLPRQSGKSTTVTAYILWLILFKDSQNIAILANKGSLARDLLGKIQFAYEYLPNWLQQGIVTWNKGNIELENSSKVVAAATSSSAIRGGSYNLIFLDEFAFVGNNLAEEFFSSVYPTISSGQTSKVIIVSTPNGMNHFYKMWTDAEEKNSQYVPIEVHWSQVPGRTEKWKKETIANTSEEQFRQEFECEFLGSAGTLIHPTKLRTLAHVTPIKKWQDVEIYQEPKQDAIYTMSVDVSRGVGLDYSAFIVVDISQMPYKLVAKYRSKDISPLLYPTIIYNVAKYYNEAYVLVEINDIGQQVADILHQDLEYENMLATSMKGRAGQQISGGFSGSSSMGIRTTKQVKRIGCSNLKDLVEQDKFIVQDYETIVELSTFISRGGSYESEEGSHDDLVMCCVLFSWLAKQTYFRDITNTDIRQKIYDEKLRMLDDEALPFAIIDDGQPEEGVVHSQEDIDEFIRQGNKDSFSVF